MRYIHSFLLVILLFYHFFQKIFPKYSFRRRRRTNTWFMALTAKYTPISENRRNCVALCILQIVILLILDSIIKKKLCYIHNWTNWKKNLFGSCRVMMIIIIKKNELSWEYHDWRHSTKMWNLKKKNKKKINPY